MISLSDQLAAISAAAESPPDPPAEKPAIAAKKPQTDSTNGRAAHLVEQSALQMEEIVRLLRDGPKSNRWLLAAMPGISKRRFYARCEFLRIRGVIHKVSEGPCVWALRNKTGQL